MGKVGGYVEPGGPHQDLGQGNGQLAAISGAPDVHLTSYEHRPEAEAERGPGGPEHVREAPEDHRRGLAVARGNPGA